MPCYPEDMPVARLRTAEMLLVVTLRLFARAWEERDAGAPHGRPDWRGGLRAIDMPEWGISAFGGLWEMVALSTRRTLDVRCPRCRHLSVDEGRFLQTIGLFQQGAGERAAACLGDWLPPAARRLAAAPAEALARALAEVDLVVPWRSDAGEVPTHLNAANPDLGLV